MPDLVITGIISSGIFEESKEAVRRIRQRFFDHPEELDDIGEVFE